MVYQDVLFHFHADITGIGSLPINLYVIFMLTYSWYAPVRTHWIRLDVVCCMLLNDCWEHLSSGLKIMWSDGLGIFDLGIPFWILSRDAPIVWFCKRVHDSLSYTRLYACIPNIHSPNPNPDSSNRIYPWLLFFCMGGSSTSTLGSQWRGQGSPNGGQSPEKNCWLYKYVQNVIFWFFF